MEKVSTEIEEYVAIEPINNIKLIKFDMQYNERDFFFKKIKTNFEMKWFIEKKKDRIIEGFKEFLVGDKKDYIVYVGASPYFMIQSKKYNLQVVTVDKLSLIIYRPKQVDIPVHFKFDDYGQKKYVELADKEYSNSFKVINQRNMEGKQEALVKLTKFLSRWAAANQPKLQEAFGVKGNLDEKEKMLVDIKLEEDMIKRFKMNLILYTDMCFWHIMYAKNQNALIPDAKQDSQSINASFEIEVDLPEQKNHANTHKKTILVYQRKGPGDPFQMLLPGAWKEIIVFVAMFLMFVVLMSCPSDESKLIDGDFQHEYVCKQRSSLIGYTSMAIIGVVMVRMYIRKFDQSKKRAEKKTFGSEILTEKKQK